jgi:hypothetical protein
MEGNTSSNEFIFKDAKGDEYINWSIPIAIAFSF